MVEGEVLFVCWWDGTDLLDEAVGRAAGCKAADEVDFVGFAHLEDGAKFFVEEGFDDVRGLSVGADVVEHDVHAAAACKHPVVEVWSAYLR